MNNNLWTLLAVGAIALLAALFFAWRVDETFKDARRGRSFWWGFSAASALWLAILVARLVSLQWVINNVHWIAAVLLFVCIFVVAVVNARRAEAESSGDGAAGGESPVTALRNTVGDLIRPRANRVFQIARLMLVVGVLFAVLWLRGIITLFWFEAAVFATFMLFWTFQTFALERRDPS